MPIEVDTIGTLERPEASELAARFVSVVIACLAVLALLPVFFLVGLLVKLTSKGPIFYTQIRVGHDRRYNRKGTDERRTCDQGGKLFKIHKFRTMCVDAEADGRAVWAIECDPRVTSVGNLLRKTRLDELPQLYNVIRGDMNIVGPRPERPTIFAELREKIPGYPVRQRVRPGITGLAQISQEYDSCLDDVRTKLKYDLEYLRRRSVLEDLRIMTMTVPVMLLRRGW